MKVINLWGGPGSGKSSIAAGLFHEMKYAGKRVELVTEYAKELVYEGNHSALANQGLILSEQDRRLRRLLGSVDFAITDSPLPLSILYAKPPFDSPWFTKAVIRTWRSYTNINIFVNRVKPYQEYGRTQTESEAADLDRETLQLLKNYDSGFATVNGDEHAAKKIFDAIQKGNH